MTVLSTTIEKSEKKEVNNYQKVSFVASDNQEFISFELKTNSLYKISNLYKTFAEFTSFKKKEKYFVVALQNLLKKINYLQLSLQVAEGQITDIEYETELHKNMQNYIIDINYQEDISDLKIISDIVSQIDNNFSVDEISELFSIDTLSLEENLLAIH